MHSTSALLSAPSTEELWEGSHAGWELGGMTIAQKQEESETYHNIWVFSPYFQILRTLSLGRKVRERTCRRPFSIY